MKTVSIINWENAEENSVVRNAMEAMGIEDIIDMFEGDPDMININGEKVLFIDLETETEIAVVYVDPSYTAYESEITRMLTAFYTGDSCEVLESSWDNFTDHTIAYRGGKGYSYAIWKVAA